MKFSDKLSNIKKLDTTKFTGLNEKFKTIIKDNFILKILNTKEKYKIISSAGQGKLAKIWWAGVFDKEFYINYYSLINDKSIGASFSYYIVYLLNEEKTKLYLTLAQASAGTSKNQIKKHQMQRRNLYIQNNLYNNLNILKNIDFMLSNNNIEKARDYELSVILAKEYDLSITYNDLVFKNDLDEFLSYYDTLINFLFQNPVVHTETEILTFKYTKFRNDNITKKFIKEIVSEENEQNQIQDAEPYLDKMKIDEVNNRKPKLMKKESSSYYRDPRIAKTVLVLNQYRCECYLSDKSFNTSDNHIYAEAHHLIPMKFQKDFLELNLDRTDNIISLCPICHNAIHFGNKEEKEERLRVLFKKKKNLILFKTLNIDKFDDFYKKFYKTKKT